MDRKVKEGVRGGVRGVKIGLQAVAFGKKIRNLKKRLPGKRRKAAQKVLQKAAKKTAKQTMKTEQKLIRKKRRRRTVKNTKCMGRIALEIRNRYF